MIGTRLNHYQIDGTLGRGGMGEVFAATDTKLNRRVALKVLPVATAQRPDARERFEREAKAVAALNHPNIVTIYSVEEADGVVFITMELIDGKTILDLIPRGGMKLDQILKLTIPLTDAVSSAHERGITHRDLKPANIMVTGEGRVKVLDFGLAKLREEQQTAADAMTNPTHALTGEGHIVGTVMYMSPEQAEGRPIDSRSDIFSIGVVLYEMATGQRPFKGESTVSILSSILKDTPAPITEFNQALPRDLARIVKRCLVKDPEHRYQTVKDLRNDLETLRDDAESGEILPSSSAPVPVRGGTAHTWRLAFAAALIVAIGAVGITLYRSRPAAVPAAAAPAAPEMKLTRLTSTGKAGMSAISPDGKYVAHVVVEPGQQSLWVRQVATTSNVQIVPAAAVRYDGVAFSRDGDFVYYSAYPQTGSFATLYSVPILGGVPRNLFDDIDSGVSFSPDGQRLVALRGLQSRGETALLILRADGTLERTLVTTKRPEIFALFDPSWSPDGKTIAVAQFAVEGDRTFTRVAAVDAETGVVQPIGSKRWQGVGSVAWMPDGRSLMLTAFDTDVSQIWRLSYPSGEAQRITNDLNNYSEVSVSADGQSMVVTQAQGNAHLWVIPDTGDATQAREITSGTGKSDGAGLSWTPDGKIVYGSNASGTEDLWICDGDGTNARPLPTGGGPNGNPHVSRDGRYVVFDSSRNGSERIWRSNIDGGNPQPLSPGPSDLRSFVTPDGFVIYSSATSSPFTIWKVPIEGGAPVQIPSSEPTATAIGVSPDGKQLAVTFSAKEQRGWRVGLRPIDSDVPPKATEIAIGAVQWMPDGRALTFIEAGKGVNLWNLPMPGGAPKQLTNFTTDRIFNFAWSKDGKRLALSRGTGSTDVVLVTQPAASGKTQK